MSSLLPPGSCLQFFIAHRVQQSQCSSIFHRVLLTHALALSASQLGTRKSPSKFIRVCTRRGLELTKLTYARLEDNLIRHRRDRYIIYHLRTSSSSFSRPITVAQIWGGSLCRLFCSPSHYGTCLKLYHEKTSALCSLVDSHRIPPIICYRFVCFFVS